MLKGKWGPAYSRTLLLLLFVLHVALLEADTDVLHVLIRNLLHNITNIDLCGGDILCNISDLVSTFSVTIALPA